jgi:IS30 family transposase
MRRIRRMLPRSHWRAARIAPVGPMGKLEGAREGDDEEKGDRPMRRAPSTVSRKLARNGGRTCYRAQAADAAAFQRTQRPKPAKLTLEPRLRAVVEAKLAVRWSPQQIAGWLPLAYPQDPVMRASHETIYLSLFIQSRGALRRELRDTLPISQRPPEAADRAVPGHWVR